METQAQKFTPGKRALGISERRAESIVISGAVLAMATNACDYYASEHAGMAREYATAIEHCRSFIERMCILRDGSGKLPETVTISVTKATGTI